MTPLTLLFALAFLVTVDVRILAPVLPSITESLQSRPGVIGLAMTGYALTYGTGQLFYGPLSDRRSRIAVVRAAGLGFSVSTVLAALSVTTWQFVAARFLAGSFAGAVVPLTLVFIGDTVEYGRRQVAIARLSAVTSAALAFSASIGGTVAYFVSWRAMLLGYGILALLPAGLLWRLDVPRPPAIPEGARAGGRYRDFLLDRRARFVYLAVFFEGFLLWGSVTYLGAFGVGPHGFDQFVVGLLIALFGVGTMAGGLLMPLIRRRTSENVLAGIGGTLMGAAFLLLIPRAGWTVFAVSMLVLGLGFVCLHSTLQLRGTEISQTARGKAFSLFAFNLFSGIAAGTAVLGRLVDAGRYEVLFALAGVGLFLIGLGTAWPSRSIHA